MAKEKACKACRVIFEGAKCPSCGGTESTEGFKGKINVLSPEKSEIAREIGIKKKGGFAIRLR